MKYWELIDHSKLQLNRSCSGFSPKTFDSGAKWMCDQLNELAPQRKIIFNEKVNFNAYGCLKYVISFSAFFVSAFLFFRWNIFLVPLSLIVFYFFEIHFLFLFPLLLDGVKNPLWMSIKQTYKAGIFSVMLNVVPLGVYMLTGLFRIKDPLKNWFVGCLSIIIWYQNEIRDRI